MWSDGQGIRGDYKYYENRGKSKGRMAIFKSISTKSTPAENFTLGERKPRTPETSRPAEATALSLVYMNLSAVRTPSRGRRPFASCPGETMGGGGLGVHIMSSRVKEGPCGMWDYKSCFGRTKDDLVLDLPF